MKPMLAANADDDAFDRYLDDNQWVAQQKLDGDRILICAGDSGVTALNRQGEERRNAVPAKILQQFAGITGDWCFDGELLHGQLWLFDMPKAAPHVLPSSRLEFRLDVLERLFAGWAPDECIQLLPTARTTEEKRALFVQVAAQSGEGVVFKHLPAAYSPGRRSPWMLKAKFTKTCEAIVTAVGVDGHNNCHYSMVENGELVEVGSCSLNGKPRVEIGDVIELRYLYASDDRRLYQPRMLRVRKDKHPLECTIDQLIYTSREVIA